MAGAAGEVPLNKLGGYFGNIANSLRGLDFREPLKSVKLVLIRETKQNFSRAASPDGAAWKPILGMRPRGGDRPLRDRGLLMASVTSNAQGTIERISSSELTWGTNLEYAAIHQFGGVIRPKRGKYLAIPVTREAYRAGSPRNFGKPLSFRIGPRGGVMIEKRARSEVVHYILTKQSVIPARPFLGLNEAILSKSEDILRKWLVQRMGFGPV